MISTKTRLASLRLRVVACAVAMFVICLSGVAQADFLGSVQLGVDTGSDTGVFTVDLPGTEDPLNWSLIGPVPIFGTVNPNAVLATINRIDVEFDSDPGVALGFNVTAGGAATHFTINSVLVAFPALNNPNAFASAAITVTDLDSDGGLATGTFPGSKAYEAIYNGGSVFANLVSPVAAAPDSSNTGSERLPGVGTLVIPGAVNSIQSQFDFILTANDSASGTSRFNVVPEPSAIVLAIVGCCCMLWFGHRRRR